MTRPNPKFEEPWHAEVFALTVQLNEAGTFTWSEWTEVFGRSLAKMRMSQDLDGGHDYFLAWVDALETMLRSRNLASATELLQLKQAWSDAYLRTPHGQPVKL